MVILISAYLIVGVALFLLQDFFIFQPTKLKPSHKFQFPYPYTEKLLSPEPNIQLSTLLFKTESTTSKGLVIYFHGNADDLRRWGNYAGRFLDNGYDVLMYDYRNFGKSSRSKWREENFYSDAEFVYQEALKQYPENNIILYGFSLGTGIATELASRHRPQKLVLEAPYMSIEHNLGLHLPIYPYEQLLRYHFPTYQRIKQVSCPIYLFHGTNDLIVSYRSSIALEKQLGRPILTTIEGGHHKDLANFPKYHEALSIILKN